MRRGHDEKRGYESQAYVCVHTVSGRGCSVSADDYLTEPPPVRNGGKEGRESGVGKEGVRESLHAVVQGCTRAQVATPSRALLSPTFVAGNYRARGER